MIRFVVFVSTNRDSIGTDSVYTREIDLVGIPSKDVEYLLWTFVKSKYYDRMCHFV